MMYLGFALFILAVGLSAAGLTSMIVRALLRMVGQGATRWRVSLLWTLALAVSWGAWYVVQGRTL